MAGKRGRPKKVAYADLPEEFKDSVQGKNDVEINEMISQVAKNEELNRRHKSEDQHLIECQETAKDAGAGYAEASKANKEKMAFLYDVLKARGKAE